MTARQSINKYTYGGYINHNIRINKFKYKLNITETSRVTFTENILAYIQN